MGWVIDLDGVVWLADQPIPGSAAALQALEAGGEDLLFVTNNSSQPLAHYVSRLEAQGLRGDGRVVTSATAAASLLEPGQTALVCAGAGVEEALRDRGVHPVRTGGADAVVVGLHTDFDYDRMRAATTAVFGGARLIATNDDATYPTPDGPWPGGGAILASIVTATGVQPEVAGKPYAPMVELVRHRLGDEGTGVGDRPATDGVFARALGYRWILVLSGVTAEPDLPVQPAPDLVARDLAAAVAGQDGGS